MKPAESASPAENWFLLDAMKQPACRTFLACALGPAAVVCWLAVQFGEQPAWLVLGVFLAGAAFWSPVEYVMHRCYQHWRPANARLEHIKDRIIPHAGHHIAPHGPKGTLDPGYIVRVYGVMLAFALLCAISLPLALTAPFFAGLAVGYTVYEIVHHAVHKLEMNGPVGARLKRHHLSHHYQGDDANFGVSTIFWDRLFGTFRPSPPEAARANRRPKRRRSSTAASG